LDLELSQGLFASNPYLGVYFVRMDQQDKYANSNTLLVVQTKFVPKLGIASCFLFSRLLSYCTRFGGWENCSKENVPRRIYTV